MKKEISSEAQNYLSWLNEDTLIDPDDWHFHIKAGDKRIHCTPQLTRDLVRKPLVEINEYKPNFLSPILKKDFNLVRIADKHDIIPTEDELTQLKNKLEKLAEDGQVKFWIKCLKEDPDYKIENTIVSAWMIDIRDVIDFINGEDLKIIYRTVAERRKKFDSRSSQITVG